MSSNLKYTPKKFKEVLGWRQPAQSKQIQTTISVSKPYRVKSLSDFNKALKYPDHIPEPPWLPLLSPKSSRIVCSPKYCASIPKPVSDQSSCIYSSEVVNPKHRANFFSVSTKSDESRGCFHSYKGSVEFTDRGFVDEKSKKDELEDFQFFDEETAKQISEQNEFQDLPFRKIVKKGHSRNSSEGDLKNFVSEKKSEALQTGDPQKYAYENAVTERKTNYLNRLTKGDLLKPTEVKKGLQIHSAKKNSVNLIRNPHSVPQSNTRTVSSTESLKQSSFNLPKTHLSENLLSPNKCVVNGSIQRSEEYSRVVCLSPISEVAMRKETENASSALSGDGKEQIEHGKLGKKQKFLRTSQKVEMLKSEGLIKIKEKAEVIRNKVLRTESLGKNKKKIEGKSDQNLRYESLEKEKSEENVILLEKSQKERKFLEKVAEKVLEEKKENFIGSQTERGVEKRDNSGLEEKIERVLEKQVKQQSFSENHSKRRSLLEKKDKLEDSLEYQSKRGSLLKNIEKLEDSLEYQSKRESLLEKEEKLEGLLENQINNERGLRKELTHMSPSSKKKKKTELAQRSKKNSIKKEFRKQESISKEIDSDVSTHNSIKKHESKIENANGKSEKIEPEVELRRSSQLKISNLNSIPQKPSSLKIVVVPPSKSNPKNPKLKRTSSLFQSKNTLNPSSMRKLHKRTSTIGNTQLSEFVSPVSPFVYSSSVDRFIHNYSMSLLGLMSILLVSLNEDLCDISKEAISSSADKNTFKTVSNIRKAKKTKSKIIKKRMKVELSVVMKSQKLTKVDSVNIIKNIKKSIFSDGVKKDLIHYINQKKNTKLNSLNKSMQKIIKKRLSNNKSPAGYIYSSQNSRSSSRSQVRSSEESSEEKIQINELLQPDYKKKNFIKFLSESFSKSSSQLELDSPKSTQGSKQIKITQRELEESYFSDKSEENLYIYNENNKDIDEELSNMNWCSSKFIKKFIFTSKVNHSYINEKIEPIVESLNNEYEDGLDLLNLEYRMMKKMFYDMNILDSCKGEESGYKLVVDGVDEMTNLESIKFDMEKIKKYLKYIKNCKHRQKFLAQKPVFKTFSNLNK